MARFLARRLLHAVAIVFIVVTLTFLLVHLAPGDPATAQFQNQPVSQELVDQYRRDWGLDRPLVEQYFRYLGNVARGNLGHSFSRRRPVIDVIQEALPKTVFLGVAALGISFAVGIVIGTAQGATPGSRFDHTLTAITLAVFSMPIFWFGLMMMLVFGQWLGWFPVSGATSAISSHLPFWGQVADRFHHLVLPALTLGLGGAAVVARFHRAEIAEAFSQNFIRTARAKGLTERDVVFRHALRTALLPAITMFGLSLPVLISGSVLIEYVFGWQGMGLAAYDAVGQRDYNVVTGAALFGAVMVVAGNFVADLAYRAVDPRTRAS